MGKKGGFMKNGQKIVYLRYALIVFGAIMLLIYPLMIVWPAGWQWTPPQYEYEQMIVGIYATLGVFLLLASKNPMEHASLIWFTVWSSAVHATVMLLQAIYDPSERGHFFGDIPALYLIAIVLGLLMPFRRHH
jgi:hypothetical protein